jgi:RNA polymerase sigma-70 factor (ECF subfamily)
MQAIRRQATDRPNRPVSWRHHYVAMTDAEHGRVAAMSQRRVQGPAPDDESEAWLAALRSSGPARDAAVQQLHALLLRAARFEMSRRRSFLGYASTQQLADLSLQAADDACVSVLARLDAFRGLSRFTTWAYKFAVYEAAVKARRRSWEGRETTLEAHDWHLLADAETGPEGTSEYRELLLALRAGIDQALTPLQREVLVALTINGVPIDVLGERLGRTRGALYKTLHDARAKLRAHLRAEGLLAESAGNREDSR